MAHGGITARIWIVSVLAVLFVTFVSIYVLNKKQESEPVKEIPEENLPEVVKTTRQNLAISLAITNHVPEAKVYVTDLKEVVWRYECGGVFRLEPLVYGKCHEINVGGYIARLESWGVIYIFHTDKHSRSHLVSEMSP
jgi:hypothetical protein